MQMLFPHSLMKRPSARHAHHSFVGNGDNYEKQQVPGRRKQLIDILTAFTKDRQVIKTYVSHV